MNISDVSSDAINPVSPQTGHTEDIVAPGTTGVIIPPITSFNTTAGESLEIKPVTGDDPRGIGGHGEILAVVPPLPANNNSAAESAEAKLINSIIPPQNPSTGKRVQDYLRTVKKRAQVTDLEFQRQHLPYRFRIITDGNENILIDLSILDEQNKVIKHETRNITNDNFGSLMDDISTGKGLLIDDLPQRG
jgi:hypothetical protein